MTGSDSVDKNKITMRRRQRSCILLARERTRASSGSESYERAIPASNYARAAPEAPTSNLDLLCSKLQMREFSR